MKRANANTDRILALTLKIGAYSAFACILAGLLLQHVAGVGDRLTKAGMLILLATPVLRIVVAGIQFLRERDWKYAMISVGVLGIVLLAYLLGV
jgi:uncharacterized membrane protein